MKFVFNLIMFLMILIPNQQVSAAAKPGLSQQRAEFLKELKAKHNLSDKQTNAVKAILESSTVMSQGNPAVTKHAATKKACVEKLKAAKLSFPDPNFEKICGAPFMAPLYNPKTSKPSEAKACIDQFEFPGQPCEYPLVWVRTDEAARICSAIGKRLCDAHEWEGACQGALEEPDYDFSQTKGKTDNQAIRQMRKNHNRKHAPTKRWAYGPTRKKGICAMNSFKHNGCNGGDWKRCGSNTYPTGFFPDCKSPLGVYDQNGNAAEHMNLPISKDQMASEGSQTLGHTEMKGSWFIFDKYKAHQDWCRWRAPYWHGTKTMHVKSHHNYHLGFRCCKSL